MAERRNQERVHVKAVVEILPKTPRCVLPLQVSVRRSDNARSDRDGAAAAQPHHLPVFEHAEQLGLGRERKLSYLIEEQGSVSSGLERPSAEAVSAGKRAALMAEQLALHELLGQGRAVQRDQRG